MSLSFFDPLDRIKPGEILSQYSEWIYFTLVLVFFISVAGITLRKHFDKPYVKPLIVSVGLMLTFGVFRYKHQLTEIFEGWGIVGAGLLVFMVATIPYGLCRSFGLPGKKAFYLTYILFYILSWVQFPWIYHRLGDRNLGLVNLGLLILFIWAIFKVVKFGKSPSKMATDFVNSAPMTEEINREIESEEQERSLIRGPASKMTKIEIRSIEDIVGLLKEIQATIENHRNNLPKEERERIARLLEKISKDEGIFMKAVHNLKSLLQRIGIKDIQHIRELEGRMAHVQGKKRRILTAEITEEKEKLEIEKAILAFENQLSQKVVKFNECIAGALKHLRVSPYPYDAKPQLENAEFTLRTIFQLLDNTKDLEMKAAKLIKDEKKLLRKQSKMG